MAAFRLSAHALKRVVAASGEELVPILRLNMAAGDVLATWRKRATRKPVKVQNFLSNLSFCLSFCLICSFCVSSVGVFPRCLDWFGEYSDCDCEMS